MSLIQSAESNRIRIKRLVMRAGSRAPGGLARVLGAMAGWLDMGRWLREQSLYPARDFVSKEEIFDYIAADIADQQVAYLEFGVWKGDSVRYWSKLLRNPHSVLHGFDSFEGLPEAWNGIGGSMARGTFSTGGEPPQIDDPRVRFFKGLFQDTLPGYVVPPHQALVINMDADLYLSTRYVLGRLKDEIKVGTWLYFDELSIWQHEFRAFREFVEETGMRFKVLGHCGGMFHAAFRRIA
jgi:hypothetical protein